MTGITAPETAVPPGDEPAARCPHCERPFRTERLRDLHVGEFHDEATDAERDAYEAAREDESDELFLYHLKVIGTLGAIWAFGVLAYMVVLAY